MAIHKAEILEKLEKARLGQRTLEASFKRILNSLEELKFPSPDKVDEEKLTWHDRHQVTAATLEIGRADAWNAEFEFPMLRVVLYGLRGKAPGQVISRLEANALSPYALGILSMLRQHLDENH